ncbi:MAG: AI-2E family transporter [Bacteroidetes bacterium]|nr:AI-2E family transporter [Bacteroidota bacterium]
MNETQPQFIRKIVSATFVVLLIVSGFLLFGYAIQFFLLIFGALLFAVLLRAGTNFLKAKTKMPDWLGLILTAILFFGIFASIVILIIPTVAKQAEEMKETLPASIDNVRKGLMQYEWGRSIIESAREDGLFPDEQRLVELGSVILTATLSGISDVLILLVIGIFFAASPQLYMQGVIVLVAPKYRNRLEEVMNKTYHVLKSWLLGKFLTMLFVGIASVISLMIIGVPMAFALGFIAFLLDFIPTIGPIVAAIPAILVAFLVSPTTALLVFFVYFIIQSIESYVLVPIIFKKTVSISPVITLASLVLLGILAGPMGIILATPLVAAIQLLLKELYIKDYLEKDLPDESENSFESRLGKL